MIELVEIAAN